MASCDCGVMIWSFIPITYHDGIVFHAAAAEGVSNAAVAAGRCVAHSLRGGARPQVGCEVAQEDVLLQVVLHGPVRGTGVRHAVEERRGVSISADVLPLSCPVVSPTSGAAAST